MGVEPRELVGGGAAKRDADEVGVGIENVELAQQLLGLAPCVGGSRERIAVVEGPA